MVPEIVTFNKSMQYRLEEYQQLLDRIETPCSEIIEIWCSIFEELVLINVDWQALWMLSEENCKKYELLYPTAVIVNVDDFIWQNLTATVKVLAVQEDIVLPSLLDVPIIELHPIKEQDFDETDLRDIEDWLDKCRFFFKNLWYPWDAKLDVSMMDWCEAHLKNRLKMHYDMKNGVFNKTTVNYLKALLAEARNINSISENNISFEEDERLAVVKKYLRRKVIKAELDLFEEPDLRYGMILLKKMDKNSINNITRVHKREATFVWTNGKYSSLINCLKVAESMINENSSFKISGCLQDALESSNTNESILLPPGVHVMTSLGGIDNGGIIKGLSRDECQILSDSTRVARAILFEIFGTLELENLSISKPSGIAIQVFEGSLKIANCKITSKKNNSTSRGIVIVSGCELYMKECELEGFGTAIALQPGAIANIENTKIIDCYEGIKVAEKAHLNIQNVEISSCSTFGIRVESSKYDSEIPLIGDLNLLAENNIECSIMASSVRFSENKKGNVVVKKSEKVTIFDELSETDVSNEVICISDNSEENSLNEIQVTLNEPVYSALVNRPSN